MTSGHKALPSQAAKPAPKKEAQAKALPGKSRRKFEASLGADLSGVSVHDGSGEAEAYGARAVAFGSEIHMAAGEYNPETEEGEHLLAHEVAHTVQQSGGEAFGAPLYKLATSQANDPVEREADSAADAMVRGEPFTVSRQPTGIAKKDPEEGGGEQDGDASEDKPTTAAVVQSGSFGIPDQTIAKGSVNKYIDWEFKLGGACSYEGAKPAAGDKDADVKVKAGAKGDTEGQGVAVTAEKELEEWALPIVGKAKPTITLVGAELTTKGLKVTTGGFSVGFPAGPVDIALKVIEFDFINWEKGKPPSFANVNTGVEVSTVLGKPVIAGTTYDVKLKGVGTVTFKPNMATLAKWAAEKAATYLTAEFAIVGGMVAAGALTIFNAAWAIITKDDIAIAVDGCVDKAKAYCRDFEAGVRGQGGKGKGATDGAAWADAHEKFANCAGGSVADAAKGVDIYGTAWKKVWPQIRQKAIDAYWEEHWLEKALSGSKGLGSGGFRTFKRTLDAAGSRVRR